MFALVVATACKPSAGARTKPHLREQMAAELVGGWRWLLRTTEAGTTRIEDEVWRFKPSTASPNQLVGRYVRTVEVRSDDRVPFQCNQRPWYRQRAVFDVVVDITDAGFAIRETDYRAEPSPCDHGFRHVGSYAATLKGGRLTLAWQGGTQALAQIDGDNRELPAEPWPATPKLFGPWRWDMVSYDDDGNIRSEHEWWEITNRSETKLDLTYRRHVSITSGDGKPIACANATSWSFDDAYVLEGEREEEHWRFVELASDPGDHPCLAPTPKRSLDEATAEQLGDYLILEWRGKRRQILYRPDRV
ncbi:MAG TPA: hypothetical protein VFQ53_37300 [Kofleriaceae bacterium]|nr:hypothetical protein [Kofleriaceae bacterium]